MLYVFETRRGFEIMSSDSELAKQMEIAECVMSENRDVLRRLAE
jgi:hypothetical protein